MLSKKYYFTSQAVSLHLPPIGGACVLSLSASQPGCSEAVPVLAVGELACSGTVRFACICRAMALI
jgi:hypothetical protein